MNRLTTLCVCFLFCSSGVFAQDVTITDPNPSVIYDDTDPPSPGNEWLIKGWNEYFRIQDYADGQRIVLNIDPVQDSINMGYDSGATGSRSTALGYTATAAGSSGASVGAYANAAGSSSIALGHSASAGGGSSVALGWLADAPGNSGVALGQGTSADASSTTAVGHAATADGTASTALGYLSKANGAYSAALGYRSWAPNDYTVVLGSIRNVNGAGDYANIGIGTNAPSQAVDVERSEAAARFQLTSFTDTATEAPQFIQRRSRGTDGLPAAVQNGDNLGLFSFRGYNGVTLGGSRATITAQAAGNFSNSSTPTRLIFATTPVGQTVPQQVLVITPDGKVQVNGQNLNVPDYVFEDDYELMPLQELRAFIDANGHLPGIAPAREVNANGLDLAGAPLDNLRKIEELTLYTLEQQSLIERQQATIESLERMLEERQQATDAKLARLESALVSASIAVEGF